MNALVVLSMLAPNMVVLADTALVAVPTGTEAVSLADPDDILLEADQVLEESVVPVGQETVYIPLQYEHPGQRQVQRGSDPEAVVQPLPTAENAPILESDEVILPPAVPVRMEPSMMMQAMSGSENEGTPQPYVGRYDMPVAVGASYQEHGAIAFNSAQDEYFIAWQDGISPEVLAGKRVSIAGDTLSDEILLVSGQVGVPEFPQLLYNAIDENYMLLWVESNGTVLSDGYFSLPAYNLYLVPLAADGTPQAGSLQLVTNQLTIFDAQHAFSMAYNSTDNEYLVVWTQPPGGVLNLIAHPHRLMGRRVDADATLLGSEVILKSVIIASADAAYSESSHEYLVTYTRFERSNRDYELYAQRRSPSTLSLLGAEISVSGGAYDSQLMPDIAVNDFQNEYLLVYNDTPNIDPLDPDGDYDIVSRRFMAGTGSAIGSEVTVLDSPDALYHPQVQLNPQSMQYVVMGDGYSSTILTGRYLNAEGYPDNSMRFELRNTTAYGYGNTFNLAARSIGEERHFRWITTFGRNGDVLVSILPDPELLVSNVFTSAGDACLSTATEVVAVVGKPINSYTGGLDFSVEDMAFNTSGGMLAFTRHYSSLTTSLYTAQLGYGWTHNHNARLIFPEDPGGSPGVVLYQSGAGNHFEFIILNQNTFAPAPGACGSLVYVETPEPQYVLTDMGQRSFIFHEDGRLFSWKDSEGHAWTYAYDAGGLLQTVTDESEERFLALGYDAQNRIESVSDHTGREVYLIYNPAGDLVSVQDLNGETWSYTYDSHHHLTEVLDPRGVTVERTEYDVQGRAVRQYDGEDILVLALTYNTDGTTTVEDALGHVSTHTYDSRHTVTTIENPAGDSRGKEYDLFFRPVSVTDETGVTTGFTWSVDGDDLLAVVDADGSQVDLAYDAFHNLTGIVDQAGYQSSFVYDGSLLTSSTDALNQTSTYTYTEDGFLETVTDARGNTTSFSYDEFGQPLTKTDALGNSWSYAHDELGFLVEAVDPTGMVTQYEYDDSGHLVWMIRNYDPGMDQNEDGQFNIVTEYEYDAVGNRIRIIDTYNREIVYEYDDNNRLVRTIDALGNATSNTYDAAGNLTVVMDALGRTTTFTYDDLHRLVSTTDALGHTSHVAYNADGTVASETDALGRVTSYLYDDLKRRVSTTNPLGGVTTSEYDERSRLIQLSDELGHETHFDYNALGQLISQTDALGGEMQYFYDETGNQIQVIDAAGNTTTYAYDELNRISMEWDAQGALTRYHYNELGSRSLVEAPGSRDTIYVYDSLNRIVELHDAGGGVTRNVYDAVNNLIERDDANSQQTYFTYDDLDRLVGTSDPQGGQTTSTYDAVGNQVGVTDANSHTTITTYDALNRVVSVSDPLGHTVSSIYDAVGNLVSRTDPLGNTTTFGYDALNRQISITDPLGHVTGYSYDAAGNRISQTDANGIVTVYEYNALGWLTAVVENFLSSVAADEETNVRTAYSYDAVGNRETITDANGHSTTFNYTDLGQLAGETDPLGNYTRYNYSMAGDLSTKIDANGITTGYFHDFMGRVININYFGLGDSVHFEYDDAGNRTAMEDGVGSTTWVYDALGRAVAVTDPFGDSVGYSYDPAGNRIALAYPDGKNVSYTYDAADRLVRVTDWDGAITEYSYDANGRVTQVSLPNGVISSYSYDDAGRLLEIEHAAGEETLSSFSYTYDNVGNRTRAEEFYLTTETGPTVEITVFEGDGQPMADVPVYAFDGETYTGFNDTTDAEGKVSITLPEGEYRFRADVDGTQFWSDGENHCSVPGCGYVTFTIPLPVMVLVLNTGAEPMAELQVYAFEGETYSGYNGTTDENGEVSLRLPEGAYRFRADYNGTQFWSGEIGHCQVPGCTLVPVTVTVPVVVAVNDTMGMPMEGLPVYAFDGDTYIGYHGTTDEFGEVELTLPQGSYHFRADYNSTHFWDDDTNGCDVPGCLYTVVTVTLPVTVTVRDTDGTLKQGLPVYAFDDDTYTNYHSTTDENGQVELTLPPGNYRFRSDLNGTQFWSDSANHCTVPGCSSVTITVSLPITVTMSDTDGTPQQGLPVYAFDGTTYTGKHGTTDEYGEVVLTLPLGSYRFRSDLNGTQFWSGETNHCDVPGCLEAAITVSIPVTVTVVNGLYQPLASVPVYAFDGTTYSGKHGTTNTSGEVLLTLPLGSYRFRADFEGGQYWSGAENHCDVPGCLSVVVVAGEALPAATATAMATATATPAPTATATTAATQTPGAQGTATPTATASVTPSPTATATASVTATAIVTEVGSILDGHVHLASLNRLPESAPLLDEDAVTVTVSDTGGAPQEGLAVYAFDESTYTGVHGSTDETGEVLLTLPDGDYRFRADLNGTQFWSGETNHCTVPECSSSAVTVTIPVTVIVSDTDTTPQEGLPVYAFDGTTYTGYHGTTDEYGEVELTLPQGDYRFRSDLNGTQFWSGETNHCAVPECDSSTVVVTIPVTVTVSDTETTPQEGLPVYAFDGTTYTGYHSTTDEYGEVELTLPEGDYRFRSDLNGTQFWSSEENHCTLPGCTDASVTVTISVTVIVQATSGDPYPDLPVYVFDGDTYTGHNRTSDENGQVVFTLPEGSYHFRADYDGVQFWSDEENHCDLPGCLEAVVEIPGGMGEVEVTIDYTYDSLYRLTAADYDDGTYFHYTYDAVGNRLTEETQDATSNYTYDIANRLTDVDGVAYTWDANGNLLSDGTSTYTYDAANRLVGLVQGDDTYAYTYNGLGDRLSQTINGETTNYTLDIDTYLTQVLADGTNTYLYGQTRIGEEQPEGWQVHLADALGSVRQLADAENAITLAQSYTPYGETLYSEGEGETAYEYTGQIRDASGLTYLRARYLNSSVGRFISRDPSGLEENLYLYAGGNPILYVDPSGYISISENDNAFDIINDLFDIYGIYIEKDWGWFSYEDLLSPSFVLTPDAVTCTWRKGNWKDIGELRIVEEAIDLVASGLGGPDKFRMAMGSSVRISRWDLSAGSFAPPGILKSLGDVVLSNDTFDSSDMYAQYTIIHELGHVWDYNTGKQLSKGLMNALQTWICNEGGECRWYPFAGHIDPVTLETISEPPPGSDRNCWGPHCDVIPYAATYGWGSRDHPLQKIFAYYGWWPGIEDWADTFAEYIYPDYHSWRERTRLELGGVREAYVKKAIESIQ